MGIKYHSEGIGKNKKIRKQRKKPLPLGLMEKDKNVTAKRIGAYSDGSGKNIIFS